MWLTQNGHHFANDIWKCILFNEKIWIHIKISLAFVPINIKVVLSYNEWVPNGHKPLSEVGLTDIYLSLGLDVLAPKGTKPSAGTSLAAKWWKFHSTPVSGYRWLGITFEAKRNRSVVEALMISLQLDSLMQHITECCLQLTCCLQQWAVWHIAHGSGHSVVPHIHCTPIHRGFPSLITPMCDPTHTLSAGGVIGECKHRSKQTLDISWW